MLPTTHRLLSTIHRLPSTAHRLLSAIHRLPSTTHRLPSTIHRLPSTAHRLAGTAHRLLGCTHRRLPGSTHRWLPSPTHQLLGTIHRLLGTVPDLAGPRLPRGLGVGGEGPADGCRTGVRVGGARLPHGVGRRGDGLGGRTLSRSPLPLRLLRPMNLLRPLSPPHPRPRRRRLAGARLRGLRLAPRALGTRHQQQVVVLGGVVGGVEEGVRGRRGDARLLHPACALRQSLARDLAGVGHAYPSPIG
ncbi:hypothetical protein [Streptomyces sp. NPDC017941]|uniref:hypothetical protein n=1 Tax=Streptomyces sp. NPDC017941 TaxID=3365018 RepID=UPI0037BC1091